MPVMHCAKHERRFASIYLLLYLVWCCWLARSDEQEHDWKAPHASCEYSCIGTGDINSDHRQCTPCCA